MWSRSRLNRQVKRIVRISIGIAKNLRTSIKQKKVRVARKKQRLIGVIALSDVVRHESKSSLYVVSSIFKQNTFEELAQLKESVEASFVRLVNEDANSRMIGSLSLATEQK